MDVQNCPNCNSNNLVMLRGRQVTLRCENCSLEGPAGSNLEEAKRRWNHVAKSSRTSSGPKCPTCETNEYTKHKKDVIKRDRMQHPYSQESYYEVWDCKACKREYWIEQ